MGANTTLENSNTNFDMGNSGSITIEPRLNNFINYKWGVIKRGDIPNMSAGLRFESIGSFLN